MRVWIVGAGTLIPDSLRGSPAHWVQTGESRLLLDCGAGALRTLARLGLEWWAVTHLLLTHFHTDHVAELAPLLFALKHGVSPPREAPLDLLGPVGLHEHLAGLTLAHGPILEPGFQLRVKELAPGDRWRDPRGAFEVKAHATRHTPNSLGFRIEADGVSLGYTGDTGPDLGLASFFRGCAVLIAECSHPDGGEMETHLTPGGLAAMATEAGPKVLVPVHSYPPLLPESVPFLLKEAGYEGRVLTGWDGLGLDLTRESVRVLKS